MGKPYLVDKVVEYCKAREQSCKQIKKMKDVDNSSSESNQTNTDPIRSWWNILQR